MSAPSTGQSTEQAQDATAEAVSLVSLLGEQRAAVVRLLHREGEQPVVVVAEHLDVSEVAARRHLAVLEDDGFVVSRTVKQGRGRPAAHFGLTERARELFPHRYAEVASDLMEFITSDQGREGLRRFLRWRLEQQTEELSEAVTAEDLPTRLEQLADALSAAGYDAAVEPTGDGFQLEQGNCAIYDVARHHPELCAYEAASFSRVLGDDVVLSRRETAADGSRTCICSVRTKDAGAS